MDTSSDPLLPEVHGPIPRDRFHIVYGIFYLLGLGSLIPWNFFITASDYFKYKFRNTTAEDFLDPHAQTSMQAMFESYLTVASTTSNLLFNFVTALLVRRICIKTRMVSSLVITIVMFISTVVLTKINTDSWQYSFLIITLLTAIIINASSSVMGASLFGLASLFPARYMQAAMTGQAVGGLFAAVANIASLAIGSSFINSGLTFFLAATISTFITLIAFCCLYHIDFSKYHIYELGNTFNGAVQSEEEIHVIHHEPHGCSYYTHIMKQIWIEGLTVCLVFFVTLSCFPALASSIISLHKGDDDWSEKFFSAFICFLLFNAGDWSGRSIAGSVQIPSYSGSKYLLVFSLLRVGFVPLLMYCNAQPRAGPAFFTSDWYPVIFITLLGLTNGYFSTLAMMYGPKRVAGGMAESTGALMSTFLTTGLVSGSLFAILLMKLLTGLS